MEMSTRPNRRSAGSNDFDSQGKFLDIVGDVKVVPGCKKVSIAVSQDTDRVYMLDITRNHIVLMKRRDSEASKQAGILHGRQ